MRMKEPTPIEQAADIYNKKFMECAGHLNRKDRRTAHGRMVIAEAEAAALRAKVEYLEQELAVYKAIQEGAA